MISGTFLDTSKTLNFSYLKFITPFPLPKFHLHAKVWLTRLWNVHARDKFVYSTCNIEFCIKCHARLHDTICNSHHLRSRDSWRHGLLLEISTAWRHQALPSHAIFCAENQFCFNSRELRTCGARTVNPAMRAIISVLHLLQQRV